jgi:hypothetical protein
MENLYIKEIENKNTAIDFVQSYHYSKILPRITKNYLGIYGDENVLKGVVTLGWGTQPKQSLYKMFYKHTNVLDTKDYIEIGKMCFLPEYNGTKNFGSYSMKLVSDWVKENLKHVGFLYTLADGIMGKCGFVYQASNFIYLGSFKTSVYMFRKTGEKLHPRSAKEILKENAIYDGVVKRFWLTHEFCEYKGIDKINGLMFRYMHPLTKDAKKIILDYPEYKNIPYPKEKDLLFERRVSSGKFEKLTEVPKFNMNIFENNFQKY